MSDSNKKKYRILKDGVDIGVEVKTINIGSEPIDITEEDQAAIDCFIKTGESIGRVTVNE